MKAYGSPELEARISPEQEASFLKQSTEPITNVYFNSYLVIPEEET